MRYLIIIIPMLMAGSISYARSKAADTIRLYFDLGISTLNPAAKHTLDSLLYNDVLIAGKKLGIIGYADYTGSDELNAGISEKRAKTVETYLVSMGIRPEDIQAVVGKGEVKRADTSDKHGYTTDRRVDIIPGGIKGWKPPVPPPPPPAPPKPAETIDISKVKKNEAIRLNKIFFIPGRHTVRDESLPELDNLYNIMKGHPTLKIRIEGHICCLTKGTTDGYDEDSQDFKLSENRAKEIYDYLADKGIDEERMEYKGFGKSKPLVREEKTEEDENMNRRVEIRILEK